MPHDGWLVTSIDPGGPAAGRLESGDRLIAIGGDAPAEVLGTRLTNMHGVTLQPTTMQVEDDNASYSLTLVGLADFKNDGFQDVAISAQFASKSGSNSRND